MIEEEDQAPIEARLDYEREPGVWLSVTAQIELYESGERMTLIAKNDAGKEVALTEKEAAELREKFMKGLQAERRRALNVQRK